MNDAIRCAMPSTLTACRDGEPIALLRREISRRIAVDDFGAAARAARLLPAARGISNLKR